jgi:hypothetical protein
VPGLCTSNCDVILPLGKSRRKEAVSIQSQTFVRTYPIIDTDKLKRVLERLCEGVASYETLQQAQMQDSAACWPYSMLHHAKNTDERNYLIWNWNAILRFGWRQLYLAYAPSNTRAYFHRRASDFRLAVKDIIAAYARGESTNLNKSLVWLDISVNVADAQLVISVEGEHAESLLLFLDKGEYLRLD